MADTGIANEAPRVMLLTARGELPDWAPRGEDLPIRVEPVDGAAPDGALEAALRDAAAAVIDASLGAPLSIARRVHRIAPAAQLVVVADALALQDLRRAMMFTPGIGEVWLIEPGEATVGLLERAAGIGRKRQRHAVQARRTSEQVASLDGRGSRPVLLADQYLATLLELLPGPVLALDEKDGVLFANPAAEALLGKRGEDRLSGSDLRQALGADASAELSRALERGRVAVVRTEVRVDDADGERILHASVAPVAGERPVRALLLHDVTEQVHARERLELQATELESQREILQEQNEELQAQAEELEAQTEELARQNDLNRKLAAERAAMLGNIAEGVIIADVEGRIIFVNDAARRIHGTAALGVPAAEWSDAYGLFDLRGNRFPPEQLPLARALRDRHHVRDAEWQIQRPDATRIWVQGSAAPVIDEEGHFLGAVVTMRDVTERRARDEERERLLTERDRAVSELRAAMTSRSRFYASMSHELRTPINAIIGYNDLMRTGVYGEVPDQHAVALDRVNRAANHLLELINDVLDLSKIEAGKLTVVPEPVVIGELIADLRATMQPLADQHEAELRFAVDTACDRAFMTDPRRLRQILMNLLSNAVRYGAGSPVDIRCTLTGDRLVVAVEDRGPGIPEDRMGQIFDEFVQLGSHQRGGTGLGLPIAQALARQLGGEIRARSEEGVGSTFTVELSEMPDEPIAADDPVGESDPAAPPGQA